MIMIPLFDKNCRFHNVVLASIMIMKICLIKSNRI